MCRLGNNKGPLFSAFLERQDPKDLGTTKEGLGKIVKSEKRKEERAKKLEEIGRQVGKKGHAINPFEIPELDKKKLTEHLKTITAVKAVSIDEKGRLYYPLLYNNPDFFRAYLSDEEVRQIGKDFIYYGGEENLKRFIAWYQSHIATDENDGDKFLKDLHFSLTT